MLLSFLRLYDQLPSVLDPKHLTDFTSVNEELLKQICSFLTQFDDVINELSDDKRPTLYRVIPLRRFLIDKCAVDYDDLSGLQTLKRFLGEFLFFWKWTVDLDPFLILQRMKSDRNGSRHQSISWRHCYIHFSRNSATMLWANKRLFNVYRIWSGKESRHQCFRTAHVLLPLLRQRRRPTIIFFLAIGTQAETFLVGVSTNRHHRPHHWMR